MKTAVEVSPIHKADNLMTSKQYDKAIELFDQLLEGVTDLSTEKFITNRILHCKFMQRGILDCRSEGIGIFKDDAQITIQEAMDIISDVKITRSSSGGSGTTYDNLTLDQLQKLKDQFNKEKNKTEARKVRAAMRKLS